MKILFTVSAFPFQQVGGARVYAYYLARAMMERGHTPVILFPEFKWDRPEGEITENQFDGIKLIAFNRRRTIEEPTRIGSHFNHEVFTGFKNLLLKEKIDIVHFHHAAVALTHCIQSAAYETRTPNVMTLHMFDPMCPKGTLLYQDAELCEGPDNGARCATCNPYTVKTNLASVMKPKWIKDTLKIVADPSRLKTGLRNRIVKKVEQVVSKAMRDESDLINAYMVRNSYLRYVFANEIDLLISPSNFLRDKFVEWGIDKDHIIQISNGMDKSLFNEFKKNKSDVVRFGFMGRFSVEKGLNILIEAFNNIKNKNVKLDIYGEYNKTLDQRALKDKLGSMVKRDGVVFRGGFDNNRRIAEIMSDIDVLVVPSIWYENQPLTIQEAFLSGTPVITSGIGGMAEMVKDGVNGLLFKKGAAMDLAEKMGRFVEDRALIEKLKPNSENVIPMEKHAEALEKVYKEVMNKKGININ